MSLTEKVIHASTLSQNRIRRFNNTDVFERIFINIVEQAMAKGLVAGQQLFTDSTHLKANADKNKYTNELKDARVSAYLDMLDKDVALDREREGKKPLKARVSEPKTKNTKVSTTDPESGFMTRDNKPQGFFYLTIVPSMACMGLSSILMRRQVISMTLNPILNDWTTR